MITSRILFFTVLFSLTLSGCTTVHRTSTVYTPLEEAQSYIPEAELLDLGVIPFDPGIDQADDDELILPELRLAEGRYQADQLVGTIEQTAAWGAVRILPSSDNIVDVYVEGTILHSDGENLKLDITVSDTRGKIWYTKQYSEVVGKYAYRQNTKDRDPFQGIYNRIANDILKYKNSLASHTVTEMRAISDMRFVQLFIPDEFDRYIATDKNGMLSLTKLPAVNDPQIARIHAIRERDYLFIDTLQEHYNSFSKRMDTPYQEWRAQSYDEIIIVRRLKRDSFNETAIGIASIIVGIAGASSNSSSCRAAGAVAIGAGGMIVKSGLGKRQEAQMHVDVLSEMGASLEAEIEPQVIELEDRTITLTGNVESQYQQWREILQQIYRQERGDI
jgi:hypothetical protein